MTAEFGGRAFLFVNVWSVLYINKIHQDATVCRYLLTATTFLQRGL